MNDIKYFIHDLFWKSRIVCRGRDKVFPRYVVYLFFIFIFDAVPVPFINAVHIHSVDFDLLNNIFVFFFSLFVFVRIIYLYGGRIL